MKVIIVENGHSRIVLAPEKESDKAALKQLCNVEVELHEMKDKLHILDIVIEGGAVVLRPRTGTRSTPAVSSNVTETAKEIQDNLGAAITCLEKDHPAYQFVTKTLKLAESWGNPF